MKQHIEAMVDRNVYDHIIVHSGTNDVDKLIVNDIAMNMEKLHNYAKATMAECTNRFVWSHICS